VVLLKGGRREYQDEVERLKTALSTHSSFGVSDIDGKEEEEETSHNIEIEREERAEKYQKELRFIYLISFHFVGWLFIFLN